MTSDNWATVIIVAAITLWNGYSLQTTAGTVVVVIAALAVINVIFRRGA
jgi:hypothetical protein